MHLNEAPGSAAAFCTAAENRFPPRESSCRGVVWHGICCTISAIFKSSSLRVFLQLRRVVCQSWRRFFCTISAIFRSSSVLLSNIGKSPHDITLMATPTIKQQLESYLFVTNYSVEITLTTSSILAKMGDTQSKSADKNEGEWVFTVFLLCCCVVCCLWVLILSSYPRHNTWAQAKWWRSYSYCGRSLRPEDCLQVRLTTIDFVKIIPVILFCAPGLVKT